MNQASIREFIQLVPSCSEADILSCIASCFMQGRSEVVAITDDSHYPIGIVRLSQWLAYRSQIIGAIADSSQVATAEGSATNPMCIDSSMDKNSRSIDGSNTCDTNIRPGYFDSADTETLGLKIGETIQAFGTLSSNRSHGLPIQPVAIAPAHWHLDQFQAYAQSLDTHLNQPYLSSINWVVVDGQGAYLGVLDECAVWRSLSLSQNSDSSGDFDDGSSSHYSPHSRPVPAPMREELAHSVMPHQEGIHGFLNFSSQLLENLPFPVMVQTAEGRVILQNHAWQRCVSELQEPETIRQQIARLFESTQPIDHGAPPIVFCELGDSQHDCICTCSTKDGGTRTWKFTKVPLPPFPSDLSEGYAMLQTAIAHPGATLNAFGQEPFRFARLQSDSQANVSSSSSLGNTIDHIQHADRVWIVIAQDMTTHHQLAEALITQNENLVRSNRVKDEFLECITHELKTPLTAILGLSNLLKDQAIGSLNERQLQYANLLYKSGRQLASLVNNVLTLTRLEADDFQLHRNWVDLRMICEQTYKDALELQGIDPPPLYVNGCVNVSEQLTFTLDIQPGLHYGLLDELRFKQMLVQLLSNALKFSRLSGLIELKVKRCCQWLTFTVSDTGIGIPTHQQQFIFQKFQPLDHSASRGAEGAGLGLALVQKLADLHGGTVSFISKEDEGSQFTILLPFVPFEDAHQGIPSTRLGQFATDRSPSLHEPSEAIATSSDLQTNCLVVVMETNPTRLEILYHHLNQKAYDVIVARSDKEAWNKVLRLHPHCVFLDLDGPESSALELLSKLKTQPELCDIPIITLSDWPDLTKATSLGADGQMTLPITEEELDLTLQKIHEHSPKKEAESKPITVLYLNPDKASSVSSPMDRPLLEQWSIHKPDDHQPAAMTPEEVSTTDLNAILHPYHCRVLEVDDLSQAGFLARVWKPDVILLSNRISNHENWLSVLNQNEDLSTLPIITLSLQHTETANQIKGLKVFPCLNFKVSDNPHTVPRELISPLVEVIRVAAGVHRIPRIIILSLVEVPQPTDSSLMYPNGEVQPSADHAINPIDVKSELDAHHENRLTASVQYLQMAGMQASISQSLETVSDRVVHQTVDLLLIYYPQPRQSAADPLTHVLDTLRCLDTTLPIVVWVNHEPQGYTQPPDQPPEYPSFPQLGEQGAEVIFGELPMNEILSVIQSAIANRTT
ncbi:MAG: hybrid sensor histidine kinase/response regulator [Cyanobacteria bacterium P01_E01_bin.6]